jgi:hypothetical protein
MLTKSRVWRSAVTATRKPPKYERDCQVVPNLYALAPRPLEERILSHARRIHRHGARHSRFNTEDLGYPRQSLVWNMRMNDVQLPMELLELDTSLREPTFKIPSWSVSDYPDLTPEDLCVIETFRDNERFGVTHFASMSAQWEVDEKLFREIAKKFYLPGGYARDKPIFDGCHPLCSSSHNIYGVRHCQTPRARICTIGTASGCGERCRMDNKVSDAIRSGRSS